MTQTLYAYINKRKKIKNIILLELGNGIEPHKGSQEKPLEQMKSQV
jgi:hypothetical protein